MEASSAKVENNIFNQDNQISIPDINLDEDYSPQKQNDQVTTPQEDLLGWNMFEKV